MDRKTTGIIAYIALIGWIIAYLAGDKEGAKFHLNQALVLAIAEIILGIFKVIPVIGGIITLVGGIFLFVCWIIGFVAACKDEEKEIPLLGGIKILK